MFILGTIFGLGIAAVIAAFVALVVHWREDRRRRNYFPLRRTL